LSAMSHSIKTRRCSQKRCRLKGETVILSLRPLPMLHARRRLLHARCRLRNSPSLPRSTRATQHSHSAAIQVKYTRNRRRTVKSTPHHLPDPIQLHPSLQYLHRTRNESGAMTSLSLSRVQVAGCASDRPQAFIQSYSAPVLRRNLKKRKH
jgi:hypothetical protein